MSDSELEDEYGEQEQQRPRHRNADEAGSSRDSDFWDEDEAATVSASEQAEERKRTMREVMLERDRILARERLWRERRQLIFRHLQEAAMAGDEAPPSPFLVPRARRAHFITARRLLELLPTIDTRVLRAYAINLADGNDVPTIQTLSDHITRGVMHSYQLPVDWSPEEVVATAGVMLTGCLVAPSLLPARALHRVMMYARPQHVRLLGSLTSVAARQAGETINDNLAPAHVLLELADAASGGPTPSLLLGALLVHHALSVIVPEFTAGLDLSEPLSDEEIYRMIELSKTTNLDAEIGEMVESLTRCGLNISKLGWEAERPGMHLCWRDREPPRAHASDEYAMELDADHAELVARSICVAYCASPSSSASSSLSASSSPPAQSTTPPQPIPSISLSPYCSQPSISEVSDLQSDANSQHSDTSSSSSGSKFFLSYGPGKIILRPCASTSSVSLPSGSEESDDQRPSGSEVSYSSEAGSSSRTSTSTMSSLHSSGAGTSKSSPSGSIVSQSDSDDEAYERHRWWPVLDDKPHGGTKRRLTGDDSDDDFSD